MSRKKVTIIEAEACTNHIHMLVCIPPYLSISQFMGYLKGKSSLMMFDVKDTLHMQKMIIFYKIIMTFDCFYVKICYMFLFLLGG